EYALVLYVVGCMIDGCPLSYPSQRNLPSRLVIELRMTHHRGRGKHRGEMIAQILSVRRIASDRLVLELSAGRASFNHASASLSLRRYASQNAVVSASMTR